MCTREDRIKEALLGRREYRYQKSVIHDLKRDPENIKIYSFPGNYYKAVIQTRIGAFDYDTYRKEYFLSKTQAKSLIKERIQLYGHKLIPVEEFYKEYVKHKDTWHAVHEVLKIWATAYAERIKTAAAALPMPAVEFIPMKFFVENTAADEGKSFQDYTKLLEEPTFFNSGRCNQKLLDSIPPNCVWIFPHNVVNKRGRQSAWANALYQIIRREQPINPPKEIWFRFYAVEDAERTHQFLTDKPLDLSKITYCI